MLREKRIKSILESLPAWLPSSLTVALILWLTLVPDPLGDNGPRLFPGADKVVHAIMFGYLAVMLMLDFQRNHHWKPLTLRSVVMAGTVSTLLGVAVEVAQLMMALGRGFEVADMVADASGAAICCILWKRLQKSWSQE